MATAAKPRAPTISADIAIFFIEHPFTCCAPATTGRSGKLFRCLERRPGSIDGAARRSMRSPAALLRRSVLNNVESLQRVSAVGYISLLGLPMFDAATTALLRAVFVEVCENVPGLPHARRFENTGGGRQR